LHLSSLVPMQQDSKTGLTNDAAMLNVVRHWTDQLGGFTRLSEATA